jgi:hypothetical protein
MKNALHSLIAACIAAVVLLSGIGCASNGAAGKPSKLNVDQNGVILHGFLLISLPRV